MTELLDIVQMFGEDVAVPENPESEGSRLITLKQIEQEHGVSRSALHTYRRSASFPQPVPVEGSTKIQYRADEVAAWFAANPKQQGKRTDLASQDEGAAMWSTDNEPITGPRLSHEQQERLQGMVEQAAARAALEVGLSRDAAETIGRASTMGVRGVIEAWRQATDG